MASNHTKYESPSVSLVCPVASRTPFFLGETRSKSDCWCCPVEDGMTVFDKELLKICLEDFVVVDVQIASVGTLYFPSRLFQNPFLVVKLEFRWWSEVSIGAVVSSRQAIQLLKRIGNLLDACDLNIDITF